jgi:hypothetical protein
MLVLHAFWGWDNAEQEEEEIKEKMVAEYRKNGTIAQLPPELKLIASAVHAPIPPCPQ